MAGMWKSALFLLNMMDHDEEKKVWTLTLSEEDYDRWQRAVKREQNDELKMRIVIGDLVAQRYVPDSKITDDRIEAYLKGE